jgi:hypothetical protein
VGEAEEEEGVVEMGRVAVETRKGRGGVAAPVVRSP